MSDRERSILERFWQRVGGTLILEFPLVRRTKDSAPRRVDGLILPESPRRVARWRQYMAEEGMTTEEVVEGTNVVAVQVKPHRLDLHLLGQTFFAVRLLEHLRPASVLGVALCTKPDRGSGETLEDVHRRAIANRL